MPFCPDCGERNDGRARFCQECGRLLPAVVAATGTRAGAGAAAPAAVQERRLDEDGVPVGREGGGKREPEQVLWEGRPSRFTSPRLFLTSRYKLTSERLMIEHGFLGRRTEEIDLYRVKDVAVTQTPIERLAGLGDVLVMTTDRTAPQKRLFNVRNPDRIKDQIRDAAREQRRQVILRADV